MNALIESLKTQEWNKVKSLILSGEVNLNDVDENGNTALMLYCVNSCSPEEEKIMHLLLDNHALFSPYDYGLIFFDYVTKNVFSVNNHSGFLNSGIEQLKNDYNDFIRNKRSASYIFRERKKETVINGLEDKGELFQHLYLLNRTLASGGNILKDGQIINEPNDTYLTFLERIFGKEIIEYDSTKPVFVSDYSNIQASAPSWTIFVGDATDMNKAYEFINNNKFNITQEEEKLWQKFIKQESKD